MGASVEYQRYVLQRRAGTAPLEFQGRKLAEASCPSHRGGQLRLAVYETKGGSFVVELDKGHPEKSPQRANFAWIHPTLDAACEALRPGWLTEQVLTQLGRWKPESIA